MPKQLNPGIKLGLLGGGQLAQMLALAAHKMGVTPYVLSENKSDPAQQVTAYGVVGSLSDKATVEAFLQKVDIATFESEFLDSSMLGDIQKQTQIAIHPSPQIMGQLQDRKTQKLLLDNFSIPTAPWILVSQSEDLHEAVLNFGFPLVLKKRRFGYDGYGTFILKTNKDVEVFVKDHLKSPEGFIAEKWIPFKRELACIFARTVSGQISNYPLVESLQKNSRCFWTKGPIQHREFKKWILKIQKFLKKTNYVGVLGIELFETSKGLMVNELAPRVHNSGHYTMDAFLQSQFDLHLQALLGLDIEISAPQHKGFAMVNLLGANNKTAQNISLKTDKNISLHWYGKSDCRPGRKMGHINSVASSPDKALQQALKTLKGFSL